MSNSTKIVIIIIVVVIVAWLGYLVFQKQQISNQPIKIGAVFPLTGDAATYGEPMKNAAEMAAEEINADGGVVNGRKLEVIYEDSKCHGKDALSAVQKLISIDGVRLLDGFACAEDILTAAPVIEQNKILTLDQASGPRVSLAGDYIFQTDPSATTAAQTLAELVSMKHKTAAVITEETAFASDITDYFIKEYQSRGGKIVASQSYSPDTRDFRSILAKVKQANPEAIFVNPQTEISGGLIIKQARELGIHSQLFGLDTPSGPTTRQVSGKAIEGMIFVTVPDLAPDNPVARDFLAKYKVKFGEPPFPLYLAAAYDSIYLISNAIRAVGDNPTKMKDYFYAMPDYNGAVGRYHFDKNGDIAGISFVVKKIQNGNLVTVNK